MPGIIIRAVYSTALVLLTYFTTKLIFRFVFNYYLVEEWGSMWSRVSLDLLAAFVVILIFNLFKKLFEKSSFSCRKTIFLFSYSILIIFFSFLLICIFNQLEINLLKLNFELIALGFLFLLLSAIREELIYRFLIFETLKRKNVSNLFVLIFSSILFGISHLLNPNIKLLTFVSTMIGGFLLGFIYLEKRNVWNAISFHLGWNFSQLLLTSNISGIEFLDKVKLISISNSSSLTSSGIEGSMEGVILLLIFTFFYVKHRTSNSFLFT